MPSVDLAPLAAHPIFGPAQDADLAHSTLSLRGNVSQNAQNIDADGASAAPRPRRAMCIRETDVIIAVGPQIRIAPVARDSTSKIPYKVLNAPNVRFNVSQMTLNPTGKLLAVSDGHQAVVVILPRFGYWKADAKEVEVKSLVIGPQYHKRKGSPSIVKLDWHPWGEHGALLLVGTSDGNIREYEVSKDPEEPQQQISFMPPPTRKTILADVAERELVSFSLAAGQADWGPLTLYGLMRSGDIYAFSPYMPVRAAIPSGYVWSLKHYVSEKLDAAEHRPGFAALYEQQLRFVQALADQLPSNKAVAGGHAILVSAPKLTNLAVARQGPFLLQPEPHEILDGSSDAVDFVYVQVQADSKLELGVVLVSYQNGKVDILLDLDKVEARWEHGQAPVDMDQTLTVFESIDLGTCETLRVAGCTDIAEATAQNYPLFQVDPVYSDTVYVYHSFGIHCLWLRRWVTAILAAIGPNASQSPKALPEALTTDVICMLDTTQRDTGYATPVIGLTVPNHIYTSYGLVALTASLKCIVFDLSIRYDTRQHPLRRSEPLAQSPQDVKAFVCTLEPWSVPAIFQTPGVVAGAPRIRIPPSPANSKEIVVNPDTLRLFGSTVDALMKELAAVRSGSQDIQMRVMLQQIEQARQVHAASVLNASVVKLRAYDGNRVKQRIEQAKTWQKELLQRMDRAVQLNMDAVSPMLSKAESEWFEEIRLAKRKVQGQDGGSLQTRTDAIETELDQLRPDMSKLSLTVRKPSAPMGSSQSLRVMKRLREEADLIKDLTSKLLSLRERLGMVQEST
ncbi:hypothetical protein BKA62DRAFT_766862 [Auriculariales sp. MPI-PUGE-AT-0066]|nr:hypothetical protein BKA62DRAFT_766862 [Auriculariales sp. MPI-PUGE-AT-0066]